MNVDQILETTRDRKIALFLVGDKLKYRSPNGALSPKLREAIRQQREPVVRRLRETGEANNGVQNRCLVRCDFHDWFDEQPVNGRIRTICGKCGRFIGYRPQEP